jgi:hypothetical protein
MKFFIQSEDSILSIGKNYSFRGSFSENELMGLKLTGLDREILSGCKSAADYLLALEVIYRKHEADDRNEEAA